MKEYIYYGLIGLEFLVSIVFAIITRLQSKKNKETSVKLEDVLKEDEILSFLPDYIAEAEKIFGSGNGKAKLDYVLNKVHICCLENSISFVKDYFSEKVEAILATPQKKEAEDD